MAKGEILIVEGSPVVVKGPEDDPKGHIFHSGKVQAAQIKARLKKKGLLEKIPPGERRMLSLQQRQALKNFLLTGGDVSKKRECAVAAGYKDGPGAVVAIDRVLNKRFIREAIVNELNTAGVDLAKIAAVIKEGLDAQHPMAEEGRKDYHAIEKFLRDAINLHDLNPVATSKLEIEKRVVNIHMTTDDASAWAKFKQMRKGAADEAAVPSD